MSDRTHLERLLGEIRAEAKERRGGRRAEAVEQEIEAASARFQVATRAMSKGDRLKGIIRQTERLSFINYHVPTAGRRPYFEPVKKAIQSGVRWYVGAVVHQIQEFIRADLYVMRLTADAIEALEQRVKELEARVAELQDRGSQDSTA